MDVTSFCKQLSEVLPTPPSKIAVAVSGGSDSLCLLYYVQQWLKPFPQSCVVPLILDDGLRATSRQEAIQVQQWVAHWGLSGQILQSPISADAKGIPERARKGKYEALALACHDQGIRHVFLGHHQGDVLETVWMRRVQGSHWRGLAGISAITFFYGLAFLRPLLHTPKSALQRQLRAIGQPWLEDSFNQNPQFFRNRTRIWLASLSSGAYRTLIRLIHSYRCRREEEAYALVQQCQPTLRSGYLVVPEWERLKILDPEQGNVLLRAWMGCFVFAPWRTSTTLWHQLVQAEKSLEPRVVATGGGCLFVRHKQDLFVFREWGRIPVGPSLPKATLIWDYRFFCYGVGPVGKRSPPAGPWIWRYGQGSLPDLWPHPAILHRWCSLPLPYFTHRLKDEIFLRLFATMLPRMGG